MIADMKNELTQKDIDEMQQEIEYRKLVVRPKALEDVKETRAQGDLSENFEYHAAKKFKNQNESRIKYLERMIRTAVIIEDTVPPDTAGINKTVTIYLPEDKEEEIYTLVSTVRGNSLKGLISVESPLGRALVGHKTGDRISVRVSPDYSYTAEIRKIEDAGSIAAEAKLTSF
jgi:transcription elongation factor GreA